jgi:hypothetical protein
MGTYTTADLNADENGARDTGFLSCFTTGNSIAVAAG